MKKAVQMALSCAAPCPTRAPRPQHRSTGPCTGGCAGCCLPFHSNDRVLEQHYLKLAAQPMNLAPACCRLPAAADVLGTGVSLAVSGGMASGTAIEGDPAAGLDGGRLMYSRPAGGTTPRGAAPGIPLVWHSAAVQPQPAWCGRLEWDLL